MARRGLSGFIFRFSIPNLDFYTHSHAHSLALPLMFLAPRPSRLALTVSVSPSISGLASPRKPCPSSLLIRPRHNSGVLPRVRRVRASKCAQDHPKPAQRFWMRVRRCNAWAHQVRPLHGVSSAVCGKLVFALVAVELGVGLLIAPGSSEPLFTRMQRQHRNSLSRPVETILELIFRIKFWSPEMRIFLWNIG